MDQVEKEAWLCFSAFPQIGPKRFKLLKEYFGSATSAWQASGDSLKEIGLPFALIEKFLLFRQKFDLSSYLIRLGKFKIKPLILEDENYPDNLKCLEGAPIVLYTTGEVLTSDSLSLGVVGTRKVTSYGKEVTEKLTANLVDSGLTIVSGLAYGVDFIAHQTALNAGGRTIGVWAGGLDTIDLGFRKNLVEGIVNKNQGAIVTEFPLGFTPNRTTFPQRNRIISGLSLGVLVTEAAEDSGSLITAEFARKQGKKVFAVPGPITSNLSKGTAQLLKNGARLVTSVTDITSELALNSQANFLKAKEILPENEEEAVIIGILNNESLTLDELARRTHLPVSKLASVITLMEMKGKVKNSGDGKYYLPG